MAKKDKTKQSTGEKHQQGKRAISFNVIFSFKLK